MKKAVVLGAGGFIGSHLVKRLKSEGYLVTGVDLKYPEFAATEADEFIIGDLREEEVCKHVLCTKPDEVYQLAADMGGAGYLFTGAHDAEVMHNSALINLHTAKWATHFSVGKVFYSSSACIYPKQNQTNPDDPRCYEASAYPADPDSEYGWEKLFSERLYASFHRNYGLEVRIARFHNVYGPEGTWQGGKEKAPAAICRKVAQARNGDKVEVWGDGRQTRSFLYIDDCLDGIRQFMASDFMGPVNIGSEEMISINDFTEMIIDISGKSLDIRHVEGPQGVRGRNSDNALIRERVGWHPRYTLREGIEQTYLWIAGQLNQQQEIIDLQRLHQA
ncbi:NAD-dependent epimerase/dehydratase family protein [Lewinella sp. LCG006]|uniref:NAD-dependent epimerase/dehydratase family protein n=1 Tax=Lewinella sp. LCG006 TaxID=3231911 RepID=UPI00346096ED